MHLDFRESDEGELRRIHLSRTWMNRGKREGWAWSKPTSNSRREQELLGSYTHPTNTIASGDELAVNSCRTSENSPSTHSGE
jgi:hypothetical protein